MSGFSWNFGDVLEAVDEVMAPDAPALIHDDDVRRWDDFATRSNRLASALVARGAAPDDKLAFYLRNGFPYLEGLAAAFKARLVHANVNFRYLDDELVYILENSDARFVLYDVAFRDRVAAIRSRCPGVELWIETGSDAAPEFAIAYEALVAEGSPEPLRIPRSGDDLLFMYTGGTTGMPKAVMWRHEDLWGALGSGSQNPVNRGQVVRSLEELCANVAANGPGPRQLVACPLMHGTGLFTAIGTLLGGGSIGTLGGTGLDPAGLFDLVEKRRMNSIIIVGDAFARPLLDALEAEPERWDLSSLKVMISSGVMWSREVKLGLLRHLPKLSCVDLFGSSEAIGFGRSITSAKGEIGTAKFAIGERCKVFTEDHREVTPGSDEPGFIARCGPIPVGYYKDPEKSARTFPTIDGVRYSIPGDWCTVEEDGSITLLGRGSACINSAGEKIYPEEVEEVLKRHAAVADALVFGIDDPKWGQAVTAVVQLRAGEGLDEDALRAHVREHLAGYKAPKRVLAVEAMFRAANGKADYKSAAAWAQAQLG